MSTVFRRVERLEPRLMMHGDVNLDGQATSLDALVVLNELRAADAAEIRVDRYDNRDVNNDRSITALDALLVLNLVRQKIDAPTITFELGPVDTVGLSRDEVDWAIREAIQTYEDASGIDMRIVSRNGQYRISSGTLWYGPYCGGCWTHVRGWTYPTYGGRDIQFHSGQVTAESHPDGVAFEWKAISSPQALKTILIHEFGHTLGLNWRHVNNDGCVMSINAVSETFCQSELDRLLARWPK